MNRVVMIYLDAFSSTYLNTRDTPFLHSLTQSGYYAPLRPMFAFSGIGAAMFSGTGVNTNGIWCDYVLAEDKSSHPPALFKFLLRLCDLVPNDVLSQYSRYPLHKIFRQSYGTPNMVPPGLLQYFVLKQGSKCTQQNPFGRITGLLDQLRNHGVRFRVLGLYESISDTLIMRSARRYLETDCDLLLLKLGALDHIGHSHGPESESIRRKLSEIDHYIEGLVGDASEKTPGTCFLIFSDHGMSPVVDTVDLQAMLGRLPIAVVDDYFVFLNSTVASFWFRNVHARKTVTDMLAQVELGQTLGHKDLEELGIDRIGSEYGELLFAVNEGVACFPDYYRKRVPPKGMHGYAYSSYDSPVMLVYPYTALGSFERRQAARHIDIMPTVLDLLNVPIPPTCEGRSVLKRPHS